MRHRIERFFATYLTELPITTLIGVSLATMLAVALVTAILGLAFFYIRGVVPEDMAAGATVGSLVQAFTGAALQAATAVATIALSVLALRIVVAQEIRERDRMAKEFFQQGITPLFEIATTINQLIMLGFEIENELKNTYHEETPSKPDIRPPAFEGFLQCFDDLTVRLEAASRNPTCNELLSKQPKGGISLLSQLRNEDSEYTSNPLITWTILLRTRASRFRQAMPDELWTEARSVLSLCNALRSRRESHDSTMATGVAHSRPAIRRGILFSGGMILQAESTDGGSVLNIGAAILLDIINALPTKEEVLHILNTNFFPTQDNPSNSLINALSELRTITNGITSQVNRNTIESLLLDGIAEELEFYSANDNWRFLSLPLNASNEVTPSEAKPGVSRPSSA